MNQREEMGGFGIGGWGVRSGFYHNTFFMAGQSITHLYSQHLGGKERIQGQGAVRSLFQASQNCV